MSTKDLGFVHRFERGENGAPTLLLLHGTGGDETDLIPLARHVTDGATILSPRGKVSENGMPRFFRRFAEGQFDLEDVAVRADELADFVAAARESYGLPAPVAVGFSNGANIAAVTMLRRAGVLAGAALLRAQPVLVPKEPVDLAGMPVLILSGDRDPIVSDYDSAGLAAVLEAAGADIRHETVSAGHSLTQTDVDLLKGWLAGLSLV
ncbi:alpha/beta hydrolase [Microbaculum marinum]|uniref:Alpha/beta hydrolase n=1 Tax=Microbaculum marinum TaxID=1764581 RepID=A0AAW9S575_9HYPH